MGILCEMLKKQKKFKLNLELYNSGICMDDLKDPEDYPILFVLTNRLG